MIQWAEGLALGPFPYEEAVRSKTANDFRFGKLQESGGCTDSPSSEDLEYFRRGSQGRQGEWLEKFMNGFWFGRDLADRFGNLACQERKVRSRGDADCSLKFERFKNLERCLRPEFLPAAIIPGTAEIEGANACPRCFEVRGDAGVPLKENFLCDPFLNGRTGEKSNRFATRLALRSGHPYGQTLSLGEGIGLDDLAFALIPCRIARVVQ